MSREVCAAFDLEVPSDGEWLWMPVEVIASFTVETDSHYGADADGRRSESRTEVRFEGFSVYSTAGLPITDWLKGKHPTQFAEVAAFAQTLSERVKV